MTGTYVSSILVFIAAGAVLACLNAEQRQVALPVIAGVLTFTLFFALITRRDRRLPILDVGVFYGFTVMIYSVLPLIGFLAKGMEYGPESDNRLLVIHPSIQEVANLGWEGVLYLSIYCLSYLCFTRERSVKALEPRFANRPPIYALLIPFGLLIPFTIALRILYPLDAKTYSDSYLVMLELPLLVRQIANHMFGMFVVANMALLVWLFSDFKKYRFWILALLGYHAATTLISLGSRSDLVQYLLATAFLYHRQVRALKLYSIVIILSLTLLGIIFYGIARDQMTSEGRVTLTADSLRGSNEFESQFGTLCELSKDREMGKLPYIPLQLYLGDFFSLIPQQLLPFEKMRYAEWYMEQYHPDVADTGGGYSFGALAEAAVGFGFQEIIVRAFVLGMAFSFVHRWFNRHANDFWAVALYLFIYLDCYQSFRSTSFILVTYVAYRFVPFYLMAQAFGRVQHRSPNKVHLTRG